MRAYGELTNIPLKPLRPSEKRRRKLKLPKSRIEPPTLKVSEPPNDVEDNEARNSNRVSICSQFHLRGMTKLHTVSYTLKSVKKQGFSIVAVAVVDIVVVVVVVVIIGRTAVEEFSITDTRHVQPVEALQAKVLCDIPEKVVHLVFKASSDSRVSSCGAENITKNKLHVTQEGSRWEIGRARPGGRPSSSSRSCTSTGCSSTGAGAGASASPSTSSSSKTEQVWNASLGGRAI